MRARAVEGAANAAVVAALAAALGVRGSEVEQVSGTRSRDKTVEVRGDEARLRAHLAALLGCIGQPEVTGPPV